MARCCPHCGSINRAYAVSGRAGLHRCAEPACGNYFTVTVGTVMERSRIPLHKWLMGFYLMCASKKGVNAHQLHRALGITYQSAWFMAHRIREAMRDGGLAGPLGIPGRLDHHMIVVGELLPGEFLELVAQHLNPTELDDLTIKQ